MLTQPNNNLKGFWQAQQCSWHILKGVTVYTVTEQASRNSVQQPQTASSLFWLGAVEITAWVCLITPTGLSWLLAAGRLPDTQTQQTGRHRSSRGPCGYNFETSRGWTAEHGTSD